MRHADEAGDAGRLLTHYGDDAMGSLDDAVRVGDTFNGTVARAGANAPNPGRLVDPGADARRASGSIDEAAEGADGAGGGVVNDVARAGGGRPGTAIESQWAQAPTGGFFANWRTSETLAPGTVIDRYAPDTGNYLSPAGTPFEARALPADAGPLHQYEVMESLDVEAGIAAPAFGQPGAGIQYRTTQPLDELVAAGILRPVT
jgi:hypothetical protein